MFGLETRIGILNDLKRFDSIISLNHSGFLVVRNAFRIAQTQL